MTRHEAIQILERLQEPEPYEPQITHDAYDALQMAIDALGSAQPESCDDAVSRKAVIGLLHSGYHSKSMIEEVKELPPVQPEITDEQAIEHLQSTGCIRGKRRMNRKE